MQFPQGNQFTYIIGNNGSGKSRALQENAERISKDSNVVVIASGASDKFLYRSQTKRTPNGSYRYLGNRTVGNGTHNGTIAANAVLLYIEVLENKLGQEFRDFLPHIGFEASVGVAYRKTKFSKTPAFETQQLNERFVEENTELLSAKDRPFEAVFAKSGQGFRFSDLSSGEQYIITTALKIAASVREGACYFIDEPEVSLHVEWQIKWPERFHPLLNLRPNVQAYVATHSPVIISSALKAGSTCFRLDKGALHPIIEDEHNVERILFREFNTITPNNKYLFEELAAILSKTVDGLNSTGQPQRAKDEARSSVDSLKARVRGKSQTAGDTTSIERTLRDFDLAIADLIALQETGTVQERKPKEGA